MNQTLLTVLYVVAAIYVIASIVTYFLYWRDKRVATRNSRRLKQTQRISERTLHTMELLGGWPGAFLAQRTLKHKSKKRPYQIVFWAIVVVHIILWGVGVGYVVAT